MPEPYQAVLLLTKLVPKPYEAATERWKSFSFLIEISQLVVKLKMSQTFGFTQDMNFGLWVRGPVLKPFIHILPIWT